MDYILRICVSLLMLAYLYSSTLKVFKVALNIILYCDFLKTPSRSAVAKFAFAIKSKLKDSGHCTACASLESLLAISDPKMNITPKFKPDTCSEVYGAKSRMFFKANCKRYERI